MDLFLSLERKFKAASDKEVSKQQELIYAIILSAMVLNHLSDVCFTKSL
ncbi:hypothetical protein SaSA341_0997 [Streptococcus agalactiae]|nr:hypothetical protein SaSA341_0997 [Streptococcus agalactiae]